MVFNSVENSSCYHYYFFCLTQRKREAGRESNIDLFFHLLMSLLIDSCMCPDQRWNTTTLVYLDDALTN